MASPDRPSSVLSISKSERSCRQPSAGGLHIRDVHFGCNGTQYQVDGNYVLNLCFLLTEFLQILRGPPCDSHPASGLEVRVRLHADLWFSASRAGLQFPRRQRDRASVEADQSRHSGYLKNAHPFAQTPTGPECIPEKRSAASRAGLSSAARFIREEENARPASANCSARRLLMIGPRVCPHTNATRRLTRPIRQAKN